MTTRATMLRRTAIAAVLCAGSCAWANRVNRPTWNAFESNLVPDDRTAFVLTLPLTVPLGLGAIVADTLVVHPATVIDDAFEDARRLWRGLDWQRHYYTQLGVLPLRAAVTPCWFVLCLLGRSAFDIPPRRTDAEIAAESERAERRRRAGLLAWFGSIAAGGHASPHEAPPAAWSDELQHAFDRALAQADALGRAALLRGIRALGLPPHAADPWRGLRDPDPWVRAETLRDLPVAAPVPAELRDQLLHDPVESVRLFAAEVLRAR